MRPLFALAACLPLCGCLNLRPAPSTARYFVLTPVPNSPQSSAQHLPVGVGPVKLPDYLFKNSLALRKSTNEVEYLENDVWAEALPNGVQRVLAANLAALLPTDQVRLSAWRPEDVACGVYVTVERFDVDTSGRGELVAWWRVVSPSGGKLLKAGQFRGSRQGAAPQANPPGAAATLSALLADLSRELASAIKDSVTRAGSS